MQYSHWKTQLERGLSNKVDKIFLGSSKTAKSSQNPPKIVQNPPWNILNHAFVQYEENVIFGTPKNASHKVLALFDYDGNQIRWLHDPSIHAKVGHWYIDQMKRDGYEGKGVPFTMPHKLY